MALKPRRNGCREPQATEASDGEERAAGTGGYQLYVERGGEHGLDLDDGSRRNGNSKVGRFCLNRPIRKYPRPSRTRRRTMSSGLIDTSSGVPPVLENSRAALPSDETVGHRWAVVLAGGDGTRLQSLTLKIAGDQRPKQFCSFFGAECPSGKAA